MMTSGLNQDSPPANEMRISDMSKFSYAYDIDDGYGFYHILETI